MKFLLGKKVGMTQIFNEKGEVIPVTLIEAGPVVVTAHRTKEKDGYTAAQVGYGSRKQLSKPLAGHLKDLGAFAYLREYRITDGQMPQIGAKLDVTAFTEGEKVKVSGITKAKGFQGVVKRHGFRGGPASHGQKHSAREPGSIGATYPERVPKGRRMAGRMGGVRATARNLTVAKIDPELNVIALKGAVPGRYGTLLEIKGIEA